MSLCLGESLRLYFLWRDLGCLTKKKRVPGHPIPYWGAFKFRTGALSSVLIPSTFQKSDCGVYTSHLEQSRGPLALLWSVSCPCAVLLELDWSQLITVMEVTEDMCLYDSGGREGHMFRHHRQTAVTAGHRQWASLLNWSHWSVLRLKPLSVLPLTPMICPFLFYVTFVMAADRLFIICLYYSGDMHHSLSLNSEDNVHISRAQSSFSKQIVAQMSSVKLSVVGRTATAWCAVSDKCTLAGDDLFSSFSYTTLTCMSFKKTIGGVRMRCFCIFNTIIVNIGYIFVQM